MPGTKWEDISLPDGPKILRSNRFYRINDDPYDRTTTVLDVVAKPGLDFWKRKHGYVEAARLLKEASDLGKLVHAMVEDICHGDDPWHRVEGTELEPYYRSYSDWYYANVKSVIYIEKVLWSDIHGYAGSLDQFVELKNGQLALLDVKTSRWASASWRLQTIAYKGAMLEQEITPYVDTRQIVHLSSKTPGSPASIHEYPEALDDHEWSAWLSTLETYRFFMKEHHNDWKAA